MTDPIDEDFAATELAQPSFDLSPEDAPVKPSLHAGEASANPPESEPTSLDDAAPWASPPPALIAAPARTDPEPAAVPAVIDDARTDLSGPPLAAGVPAPSNHSPHPEPRRDPVPIRPLPQPVAPASSDTGLWVALIAIVLLIVGLVVAIAVGVMTA